MPTGLVAAVQRVSGRAPGPPRALLVGIAAFAGVEAVAAIIVRSAVTPLSPVVLYASVGVGLAFVAAGLAGWMRRPANRQGPLMTAIGTLWIAGRLQGSAPLPFVLWAVVPTALVDALIVYALLSAPAGRLRSRLDRALVVLGLLIGVRDLPEVHGPTLLDGLDPAVREAPVALLDLVATLAIALVIARVIARWWRASPASRRPITPVYVAAAVLGLRAILAQAAVATNVLPAGSDVLKLAELFSFALIPLSLLVSLMRARLARTAVADLVVELGRTPAPAAVQAALRRALGDPGLEVHRWSPERGAYVDAAGASPDAPGPSDSTAVTRLERDGLPLARIVHDAALLDDPALMASVTTAMRLEVENERLQQQVERQLAEVRESRVRIVEAGDAERKRVERDLHDGAQQRLVSLSLSLRLLRSKLGPNADDALVAQVDAAAAELRAALAELRELARGIHPAVLTEAGLGPALIALAERSPVPVEIDALPAERFTPLVEATAYFVVAEALTNVAKYASARTATLAVVVDDGSVAVEVRDDGVGGAELGGGTGLRGLSDRVHALGGTFELASPTGAGTTLRATIPRDPAGAVSG